MTTRSLALRFLLLAALCPAHAQQSMPDMPGMPMKPPPPKPPQGTPKPNRTRQPSDPLPKQAKSMGRAKEDAKPRAAAASAPGSAQQQASQAQDKPPAESDAASIQIPVEEVQEPEALEFRTGGDLPAPELLGDVVQQRPMTVEEFLALADQGNPTLAEAQGDVDRSNQQARQAGLPPNPTVGYNGDHIRSGSFHGGEEGAFFSQEFVLGRKLALRREIYRAQGRSNEYAREVQRARVHNEVARAFFDALAAQQAVIVRDRLLKLALDTETNIHELARVGQADAAAILTTEVASEQAKVDFVSAQRLFLANFAQLATEAGQIALPPHPLTGALVDPPVLDLRDAVDRDVTESPLVKQAEAKVAVAEAQLKDARRERVPNLTVTAGEWNSGEALSGTNGRAGWESFAQAGVQLPLWNRNQGNIDAAKAILARSRQEVRRSRLWTRNQAEPLAQQYQTARFTAERYRTEMLPRARRAYQLQVTKYQQMALAYPEVLTAQHLLFTLQLSYIEALRQAWEAAVALRNGSLTHGLEAPETTGSDTTMMNMPTATGMGGDTQ